MSEHEHGSMDVTEHEKTFDGFISLVTWGSIISLLVLILMALLNA